MKAILPLILAVCCRAGEGTLEWDAPESPQDQAAGVRIYERISADGTVLRATVPPGQNFVTVDLPRGSHLLYAVRWDSEGESYPSNTVTVEVIGIAVLKGTWGNWKVISEIDVWRTSGDLFSLQFLPTPP